MIGRRNSSRVLGILALLLLAACASAPVVAPKPEDQQAKDFAPASGKAVVYVYRPKFSWGYEILLPL